MSRFNLSFPITGWEPRTRAAEAWEGDGVTPIVLSWLPVVSMRVGHQRRPATPRIRAAIDRRCAPRRFHPHFQRAMT